MLDAGQRTDDQANIAIIRAFPRLREFLATHQDPARKLEELEAKYDDRFREVFEAIRALMEVKEEDKKPKRTMGFVGDDQRSPTSFEAGLLFFAVYSSLG